MTITVLLADDQELVRAGFRTLLGRSRDITVVAEASTGDEAVRAALAARPDVVIMDIRMPGLDGIAATERIVNNPVLPGSRVIMLTTFDTDEHVFAALRAGASGFLTKDVGPDELRHAVRVVAAGDALLSPGVTRRVVRQFAHRPPAPAADGATLDVLTAREREVVRLVARGLSNEEIAEQLVISPRTVNTHLTSIYNKLGVSSRLAATRYALEHRVV